MPRKTTLPDSWQASVRRVAIYVAVFTLHLGMLMLLVGPPAPWRASHARKAGTLRNILQLSFVPAAASKPHQSAPSGAPVMAVAARTSAMHAPRMSAAAQPAIATDPAVVAVPPSASTGINWTVPTTTDIAAGSGYSPVGNFPRGTHRRQPAIHLPGSDVAIVKGLRMAKPRTQGIGGAVRNLQSFFGAKDSHCVDVDVWRGMSMQEMLERHISPDQVERAAQEYNCGPG